MSEIISLDQQTINFPSTYITSVSNYTMKIRNNTKNNLFFRWSKFPSREEEERLLSELDVYKENERNSILSAIKLKDTVFLPSPDSGEIWPENTRMICVEFRPDATKTTNKTLYLDIGPNIPRIPVNFVGVGLPPDAYFSFEVVNIGHIGLDVSSEYTVQLNNAGKVPVEFHLINVERDLVFKFTPESGTIPIGENQKINVLFEAIKVGEFNETFEFNVKGSARFLPKISFCGTVFGPEYHLSTNFIDFGDVSYGFYYSKTFEIVNKSNIRFEANVRIRQDNTFSPREIKILPPTGIVGPHSKFQFKVELIPANIQDYKIALLIDMPRIGDSLETILVTARCLNPELKIENPLVDFKKVFISQQYKKKFSISNVSDLPARYEITVPDQDLPDQPAELSFDKCRGILQAKETDTIIVNLLPTLLGSIKLFIYVSIFGSSKPPLKVEITANCVGPNIQLSQTSIKFGTIPVLIDSSQMLTVMNNSTIQAQYSVTVNSDTSSFRVEPMSGVMKPNDNTVFKVIANLEDTISFMGKMILDVKYLNPITIDMIASGSGSPVISSIPLDVIDFGYILTEKKVVKEFVIMNRSRRTRELKWSIQKPKVTEENSKQVGISITPELHMLVARSEQVFTIAVESNSPQEFQFNMACNAVTGKSRLDIFKPIVKGVFIRPMLTFSTKLIEFSHVHDAVKEDELIRNGDGKQTAPSKELLPTQEKSFEVKNLTKIPLLVVLETKQPFTVSPTEVEIQPDESITVTVQFNASFKTDFSSEVISRSLIFSFRDHPAKMSVNLKCTYIFPNLNFDCPNLIDFGNLLLNTEQTKTIKIVPSGDVPVKYTWELLTGDDHEMGKIFDVFPTGGYLNPKQEEEVFFSFSAIGNDLEKSTLYNCKAICRVAGGPDYCIDLKGAAETIKCEYKPNQLDIGHIRYGEHITRTVLIHNGGDLAVNYAVLIPKSNKFSHFSVSPSEGTISENGEVTLNVKILCSEPGVYDEFFIVNINKFAEQRIPITIFANMPSVLVSLPRSQEDPSRMLIGNDVENEKFKETEENIILEKISNKEPITLEKKRTNRKKKSSIPQGFVVSIYELDCGDITAGEDKEFNFSITNQAHIPISMNIQSGALSGSGFSIDQSVIKDLPEGETIQQSLTFCTSKKTDNMTGNVEYRLIYIFTDELYFEIHIKANILLPYLKISRNHLEFGEVIVGQVKSMVLQLQNTSYLPVEFSFGDPQQMSTFRSHSSSSATKLLSASSSSRSNFNVGGGEKEKTTSVYTMRPSKGIVYPSSFQNIEIFFTPSSGEIFSMQIPVHIKYNEKIFFITVSGSGFQLRIDFDPPVLTFPPVKPYGDPGIAEVHLVNPTNYQIEVFSYHFDLDLFVESFRNYELEQTLEESTPITNANVSKFSICVIVHGPSKSGKSTVSKIVSEHLGVPIISLSELWTGLIGQGSPAADLSAAFFNRISQNDCADGFVVDSLSVLPESVETESFYQQCFKTKNMVDDATANPFKPIHHPHMTAVELALTYILQVLDGHHTFFIGVTTNYEAFHDRIEKIEADEMRMKEYTAKEEKESLFNMIDEEYLSLSSEEQGKVDGKRREIRDKIVKDHIEEIIKESKKTKGKDAKKVSKEADNKKVDNKKKAKTKPTAPTNANELSHHSFCLLFGSLFAIVSEGKENFKAVDPNTLLNTPMELPEAFKHRKNCLLVDSSLPLNEIEYGVKQFVPQISKIREATFISLITQPKVEVSNNVEKPQTMYMNAPEYLTIVYDNPPELPDIDYLTQTEDSPASDDGGTVESGRKSRFRRKEDISVQFDTSRLTTRWIIGPNGRVPISIMFDPTTVGSHKAELLFGISNCKAPIFKLMANGTCSYPNISRNYKDIFTTKNLYAGGQNLFNFGPLLVAKDKTSRKHGTTYRETLHYVNTSEFPAEISTVLMDCVDTKCWSVDPSSCTVKPHETVDVKIGCHPINMDQIKTKVCIFVKDHPDPLIYNFAAEGSVPSLEISTLSLDFGKLLTGQSRTLSIDIKNTSKLPAFWCFKGTAQLGKAFTFNKVDGIIQPKGSFTVTVCYTSNEPFQIKKSIQFEVMDKDKTKAFSTQNVNVLAESFEVVVDFQYPKGLDHLQYGFMRVGQAKSIPCTLKNKGKFPISYKVIIEGPAQDLFTVQPVSGQLNHQGKPVSINFSAKASKVINIKNGKGLKLQVSDPLTKNITTDIPIPYSLETAFSRFQISPTRKVSFGSMSITQTSVQVVKIHNEGKFPFDFEIHSKTEETTLNKQSKETKVQQQQPKSNGKKKGPSIITGNFSISPSSGSVQPGGSVPIEIEFMGRVVGDFKSVVIFKISDSDPNTSEEKSSVVITGTGFIPEFVTDNFESIFPGLPLCLSYDVKRVNENVFVEDQKLLKFKPLPLLKTSSVDVAIINSSPIPCVVDLSMKSLKVKGNTSNSAFTISEKTVNVSPDSKEVVTITFSPNNPDNFSDTFEAVVRGSPDSKVLQFNLEGIGAIPSVKITDLDHTKSNVFSYNFGKVLLGFSKEKTFHLNNDSVLPVSVTLSHKHVSDFNINPSNSNIIIKPLSSQPMTVLYKPTSVRHAELSISMNVAENSKDSATIVFSADGASEDVILEGLIGNDGEIVFRDCVVGKLAQISFQMRNIGSHDCRFVWNIPSEITFTPKIGHLRTGCSKVITVSYFAERPFKSISFKSSVQISQIELVDPNSSDWDDSMKVTKYVKKMDLSVQTEGKVEDKSLDKSSKLPPLSNAKKGKNAVVKEEQAQSHMSKDDSSSKEALVKVSEVVPEPPCNIVKLKAREIPLKVILSADFVKYSIDTTEVTFSPTMMYQVRTVNVKLTNTSYVRYEYRWRIARFQSLRTEYSLTHEPPFMIHPSSGYIEPGTHVMLQVKFAPLEVDDFVAKFVCEIPNLTDQDPPSITVTGLSKRPLCHFTVETSDYLKRRHPDYKNKLPNEIRVVEIVATEVNKKVAKLIEFINPTSSPYSIQWTHIGDTPSPITCEATNSLVSGGKKILISFSYTPVSMKIVESRWDFTIQEHNLRVPFLFVGKVVPK